MELTSGEAIAPKPQSSPTTDPKQKEFLLQLAHDLRSPLVVLKSLAFEIAKTDLEKQALLLSSVCRIQGILNRIKVETASAIQSKEKLNFRKVLHTIIGEKRREYTENTQLRIDFVDKTTQDHFAAINDNEFYVLISNIINNSVEAKASYVEVILGHDSQKEQITVEIYDNGRGMPPSYVRDLGRKGFSRNKEKGTGLGLFHARQFMKACNAQLNIESQKGAGTVVSMKFSES